MNKEEAEAKWAQLYNFDGENRWVITDLKHEWPNLSIAKMREILKTRRSFQPEPS